MGMSGILRLARRISRFRIPLAAAAWLIEIAWLLVLADARLALGLLAFTAAFHLTVWLLTGLAGYHYILSHAVMILIAISPAANSVFNPEYMLAGIGCILAASAWVLLLRRRLFREYRRAGEPGPWGRAADPADHLMAWWDGPYMRMYAYSATTASGRRFHFPVTRFSPYDTFLTDIHTHLMLLGRGWDLDPRLEADRRAMRTGVWGLSVSLEDRDRLYAWMDDPHADLRILESGTATDAPAEERNSGLPSGTGESLRAFFRGLNHGLSKPWLRPLLRRPHFPGEDLVPDWSPLSGESLPAYAGDEPVIELAVHCIKTFYHGDGIRRLDERIIARIRIEPSLPDPDRGGDNLSAPSRSAARTLSRETSP
jgi:hypothetical protein